MTNSRGETVNLSPKTWIALVGLVFSVITAIVGAAWTMHLSSLDNRERLIRLEVGVQGIGGALTGLESRVQKLEESR